MARPAWIEMVLQRALLLIVATAGTGCGSSTPPPPPPNTCPLPALLYSNGSFDGCNSAEIFGDWYSYGDMYKDGGPGDCQAAGFTVDQCSMITTPTPGQPFTSTGGNMCTSGTAAKVINGAYSAIWGAGIGFDFNNAGADGGTGIQPWDAVAHGITGFSFKIDMLPVGGNLRVEFPTTSQAGNDAAYWGGATSGFSPLTTGGTYSFKWADVGGPMGATNPPAFDPTQLLSMQFHIVTNASSTVPYMFCISELNALSH